MRRLVGLLVCVGACAKPTAPAVESPPQVDPAASEPEAVEQVEQVEQPEARDLEQAEAPAPAEPVPTTPIEQDRVVIKGGRFASERIASFELDLTEVTVEAYARCVSAGVCDPAHTDENRGWNWQVPGRERHPINGVTATMAVRYCEWVGARLPRDVEWTWAARGREQGRAFPWGDEPPTCQRAIMKEGTERSGCTAGSTAEVGSRPDGSSRDGVLDLAGNVGEWVINSNGGFTEVWGHVIGGGFGHGPEHLGASYRVTRLPPAWAYGTDIGFRCAADV